MEFPMTFSVQEAFLQVTKLEHFEKGTHANLARQVEFSRTKNIWKRRSIPGKKKKKKGERGAQMMATNASQNNRLVLAHLHI